MNTKKQRPSASRPLLVVISGPSGVGKDAVITKMKGGALPFHHVITMTTRPQRAGERDGIDYYFVSTERFHEMARNNELLEWAKVYDHWYGVPKQQVKQALAKGQDVVVKTDVQGAATIKHLLPQAVCIFLMPASTEELAARLRQRHSESSLSLELRLKTVEEEMRSLPMFDYVVMNRQDSLDVAVSHINAIITAEKCRVPPRAIEL